MPELPEVETIRLDLLKAQFVTARFETPTVLWEKSIFPQNTMTFSNALRGKTIKSIERFGKSLIFLLDQGVLAIHLRMSGKLFITPYPSHFSDYLRVGFRLKDRELHLIDPRKFARIQLQSRKDELRLPKGIDLLSLENQSASKRIEIAQQLRKGSRAIKAVLLDQNQIAGIGNIYADETLWQVRLHPLTPQSLLSLAKAQELLQAALRIVKQAIEAGGTSLGDSRMNFQSASGRPGHYQDKLAVYGRFHLPCWHCATPIERLKIAQRSSHFCPRCQSF